VKYRGCRVLMCQNLIGSVSTKILADLARCLKDLEVVPAIWVPLRAIMQGH
jgi:hypothetical protein